ncbi:MAG: hypothetical protein LUH04_12065 [Clostridium sp.]|nr:hypothetical protein [Clostridium sp.]
MFQELFQLLNEGQTLVITLMKKGELLTIANHLKDDKVKDKKEVSKIPPLFLCGDPESLDQVFLEKISIPLQEKAEVLSNVDSFQKSVSNAKGETKEQKEKREQENKLKKLFDQADALVKSKKLIEALKIYNQILTIDTKNAKALEKVKEINAMRQPALFPESPSEPVKTESSEVPVSTETVTETVQHPEVEPETEQVPEEEIPEEEEVTEEEIQEEPVNSLEAWFS